MKTLRIPTLTLVAAMLVAVLPAGAKDSQLPVVKNTAEKLEEVSQAYQKAKLAYNYRLWECALDQAQRTNRMPEVTKFRGVSLKSLCDTVPALKTLWDDYNASYKAWQDVLRTDPEYDSIHAEYISLRGLNGGDIKQKRDANLERYNLLYDRLYKNNPAYKPVMEKKNDLLRRRNEAIIRYLLDYYRARGEEFVADDVFAYSERRSLARECPELSDMEQERDLLAKIKKELHEQLLREKYGIPKDNPASGKVSFY